MLETVELDDKTGHLFVVEIMQLRDQLFNQAKY